MANPKLLGWDSTASGVLYTDRRDFYLSPNLTKNLWTDVAPFTTVITPRSSITVPDPDFKMFEGRTQWRNMYFDATGADAWTVAGAPGDYVTLTSVVDGITGIASATADKGSWVGYVCEVWGTNGTGAYKGHVVITAVGTVKLPTIKVLGKANTANMAMAAIADNDRFYVVGSAFGEASTSPDAWSDELTTVWNSTQILRTSVEISGTLMNTTNLRGYSREIERLRYNKGMEHKILKERAYLFGMRPGGTGSQSETTMAASDHFISTSNDVTDASSRYIRATMGIVTALQRYGVTSGEAQNVFTVVKGAYKYGDFCTDTEKVFQYYPNSGFKRAFCGLPVMSYWNEMDAKSGFVGSSGWSVNLSDLKRDRLGFNFKILETPHGILQLIPTPVLRGPYANTMLVIDDENVDAVTFRSDEYHANILTENAYDGVKDEYFSDCGLKATLMEKHSLWWLK